MIHNNEKVNEMYDSNDPYIKQRPQDVNYPNYRQYDDTPQEELESQFNVWPQYDIDKLREKRQDEPPPAPSPKPENKPEAEYESYHTPLYVITAFFTLLLIIGPLMVKAGPNRGIVQACIMLTAFCMWIFWFTIYFGQMNPLMGPRLENTTVAWIAYKLVSTSSLLIISANEQL
ncbi:uncharacterized protein LOC124529831 [Vanessa cardui]|uniref:uncharacterized protein LOC124529831 n=1 Tax=Vanessa cardui TaxID=171605 RepID=UPI001F13326D|nr:uncharacterized protein LOC124529831 [Vanessa cardui]